MKKLFAVLFLTGCASSLEMLPPPPSAPPAPPTPVVAQLTKKDCDEFYQHAISVATQCMFHDNTTEHRTRAEDYLQLTGVKRQLYAACMDPSTTRRKFDCMMKINSIEDMEKCEAQ